MKQLVLCLGILSYMNISAQDPIVTANKCYADKDYQCAIDSYKKALVEKKYQEKDHSLILYRIGYALKTLKNFDESVTYLKDAIAVRSDYGEAYWTLGGTYYEAEEYLSASENYGRAIDYYKNDKTNLKTIYYWRGRCYDRMEKYADALTYYKLAIQIDSNYTTYQVSAADASYNAGMFADAEKHYKKSIQLGDADRKVVAVRYYWLGRTYLKLYKTDDALAAFRGAVEYNPDHKDAWWEIAAVFYKREKWPEAIADYTKTISMFSGDTTSLKDLYYFRGRSYNANGEYAKALKDLDAVLNISPTYKGAVWQRASVFYKQKKYKDAISEYTKAIEMYKGDNSNLDDLYYFRGHSYLDLKDTVKAKADFTQSISLNNNLIEPNIQMGHLSFAAKKYYEAKDYYVKVASSYKIDSVELARIYFKKGFSNYILGSTYFYTAKSDFQQSLKFDSLNKESRRYIADVYYSEKLYTLTEKEITKCLELYKKEKDSIPKLYIYRAFARTQLKKYKDALTDYEQADKLEKFKKPDYIVAMGQLAFETKEYDKVITYFTRTIPYYKPEQKAELTFAYFGKGRASLELKKKTAAKKDLEKALELSPGNKDIENYLAKAVALPD